jgi:hypothetical protein
MDTSDWINKRCFAGIARPDEPDTVFNGLNTRGGIMLHVPLIAFGPAIVGDIDQKNQRRGGCNICSTGKNMLS